MKKQIIAAVCSFCICAVTHGQSEFLERQAEKAKGKVVNRVENKIDQGMEKALDETEEGIKESTKKKDKKEKKGKGESNNSNSNGNNNDNHNDSNSDSHPNSKANGNSSPNGKSSTSDDRKTATVYKKFDFVAGEKIIGYDDFNETSLGDFPLGWNANSSAEIIRIDESPTKWLFITSDGYFMPEFIKELPENFTLEFDVFNRYVSSNILSYGFDFVKVENSRKNVSTPIYSLGTGFQFNWEVCIGQGNYKVYEKEEVTSENAGLSLNAFKCENGAFKDLKPVHVSIWRQKNRLRIYLNEEKVLDIPYGMPVETKYNAFRLSAQYMNFATSDNKDEFMVSNFRYAVGAPDTRSKLITEGKLVSRGILFDTNSDKLKGESYGALKDIAQVLNENAEVNVKIVGHTDSDGEENSNLELSKKRAVAVKQALVKDFNVAENRLSTDGKGESEPSEPNTSSAGKANNRRVEFIKL